MKKVSCCFGAIFMMAIMILTSCLGDGSNVIQNQTIGVVTYDKTYTNKVLDVGGGIYFRAANFTNMSDDGCYLVYYQLDYDSDDNANAGQTGTYTVSVLDYAQFEQYSAYSYLTDTSQVLTNEVAISSPAYQWYGYLKGRAFFGHVLNQPEDQQNYWNLSYDYNNMMVEEGGYRIYELYLRSTIKSESSKSNSDQLKLCAYNMQNFFETAARAEKEQSKTEIYFRFNYVSEIKDDNLVWKQSDKMSYYVSYILDED